MESLTSYTNNSKESRECNLTPECQELISRLEADNQFDIVRRALLGYEAYDPRHPDYPFDRRFEIFYEMSRRSRPWDIAKLKNFFW